MLLFSNSKKEILRSLTLPQEDGWVVGDPSSLERYSSGWLIEVIPSRQTVIPEIFYRESRSIVFFCILEWQNCHFYPTYIYGGIIIFYRFLHLSEVRLFVQTLRNLHIYLLPFYRIWVYVFLAFTVHAAVKRGDPSSLERCSSGWRGWLEPFVVLNTLPQGDPPNSHSEVRYYRTCP